MYRLPAASTARKTGLFRQAWVAAPPSPQKPMVPLPATVVMVPSGATRRTRLLPASAMYRLPAASTNRPYGMSRHAWVAGPPSPQKPLVPLPATVVMVPSGATRRTRSWPGSAMYRLPAASTARPHGASRHAWVAGPPSPQKPAVPLPATVVMVAGLGDGAAPGWSALPVLPLGRLKEAPVAQSTRLNAVSYTHLTL